MAVDKRAARRPLSQALEGAYAARDGEAATLARHNEENRVAATVRGRGIHIVPVVGGWSVEIEGHGVQPFKNQHFNRYTNAYTAMDIWRRAHTGTFDDYGKE